MTAHEHLQQKIRELAKEAKEIDPDVATVLLTLCGDLNFYGASGLAQKCREHAKEMLGRINQLKKS